MSQTAPPAPAPDGTTPPADEPGRWFATSSARSVALEYTRLEEIDYLLHRPIRLPRLPRPPVRKMLSRIPDLIPSSLKRSRGAHLARKYPAFAAWILVFTALGVVVATHEPVIPHPRAHPARYQKWLEREGAQSIRTALAEIGPTIKIPSVRAQPVEESTLGYYTIASGEVTFNSNLEFDPLQLLDIAAHECVHGIFHQSVRTVPSTLDRDYVSLVSEVAAYVLGAHITGAALSRDGRDGSIVTEHFFQSYRSACDPSTPRSMYNHYLTPDRIASGDFDRQEWHSVLIHFGAPLALVDGVYEVCYYESNPVDAAHKISQRFLKGNLAPKDRRILEEFERTKKMWN